MIKHCILGYVLKKRRYRAQTTNSNHSYMTSPNRLQQDFYASAPNQVYVGDITYIPTSEGWLYLAVVIDLYSRKIVGWSMAAHMTTPLVNDALFMALKTRYIQDGLIWHTDRGSQYASDSHRELLSEHGVLQSMSRRGNCYDNAVAESFFFIHLKLNLLTILNLKQGAKPIKLYLNILRSFTIAKDYIQVIIICHLLTLKINCY